MRNILNKNFTEQEVIDTVKLLFSNGWQNVKMYFMIGIPTETDEDVIAIAEIGNTDSPQAKLHFEIRRLGKPVDPLKFLPARPS